MTVAQQDELPAPVGRRARREAERRPPARPEPLPRAVWAVTATWFAVLLCWSVLLPTFRSADEPSHVGASLAWEQTREWPGFKELYAWAQTDAAEELARRDGYPALLRGDAVPRADRPSFDELAPPGFGPELSNMGQHPPGYYVLLGVVTAALPDSTPYDLEVWVLRLLNVLALTPLPLLAAATARALTRNRAVIVTAALAPLAVPQLGALGAAVNNDNLLVATCATVTLGAVLASRGDLRLRTAVWTGLALAVGLLTKAWALLFVPVVVLAYVIGWRRTRSPGRAAAALVTAGATAALGGWWWIANLLRYGTLQPAGHLRRLAEPLEAAEAWPRYAHDAFVLMVSRFWAALSIKPGDAASVSEASVQPYPLWFTTTLSVLALAAVAVVLVRRRTWDARRVDGWLLVTPFVLNVLILLQSTWTLYLATGAPRGLQGRYLFPTLTGMAVAAALGATALLPRTWVSRLPVVLGCAALAFTGSAMLKVLDFHWAGSGLLGRLAALGAWSPLPPALTVLVLAAVPVCGAGLVVALVRVARPTASAVAAEPAPAPAPDPA
ncbi:DUF2142 domain-containing protein [Cellulomonas sp. ES6]|uniref:glycosyltransferase family 39 protein n=1 Tax=Cellulomonas sp. ES6 TaxID=3039384 RepID=UPI0024B774D3|nr:DUF2142 domain-containing protein [Cellulomonas sp. ES6]WHP18354.1 glycosyltransferase family 39 protein [Cellulomonas sp. ES6]